ncbi:MAG: FKBP-type peptidyl-prolyl cis-trans isomerase [Eubacteriales bacterium]
MKKKFISLTALLCLACMMLSSCITDMFGDIGVTQPPVTTNKPVTSGDETTEEPAPVYGSKPSYDGINLGDFIKVDYKGLKLTADWLPPEVTDRILDAHLASLIDYYSSKLDAKCDEQVSKEGVVEEWDYVEISFVGKMNGETFQGGSSTENVWMIVNDHDSGYIPGFASGIIGANIGEMREVPVTFPDDYSAALAGKDAVFEITVYSKKTYTLTDAFVEELTNGDYKTVADFRDYYKTYLTDLFESNLLSSLSDRILEEIIKNSTVYSYPNEQYLYYYNSNVNYMTLQAEKLGMSYEAYMEATGENDATLQQKAKDSVLEDMAIAYILKEEGKTVTDDEYNDALDYYVNYYNSMGYRYDRESVEKLFDYYYYPGYLRNRMNVEKAIQIVFEAARITEADKTEQE